MPAYLCPKGHDSTEADFCSVCGVKMPMADAPAVSQGLSNCPDCGAARDAAEGVFCEICGYNFSTGAHGELKPEVPAAPEPPVSKVPVSNFQVFVTVDASLRAPESPEAPADFAPVAIRIDKESNLIGRRSDRRGVLPEISLDRDDAVSHRHALINVLAGGALAIRDIGSSNGTRLNDAELPPMTDTPLKEGDRITLGHWTCIVVQGIE